MLDGRQEDRQEVDPNRQTHHRCVAKNGEQAWAQHNEGKDKQTRRL
jgi:hypothetical protein